MSNAWLISLVIIFFIALVFYGNFRINKYFLKKQDVLFGDLLKYDHHVFRNITMKTFGKTPLGNRSRLFISHVAFLEQSIIILPHKTDSRRKLVQSQPILQFTFGDNPKRLAGVSFYQKLDRLLLEKNLLVLKYVRTDQVIDVKAKVELDFERKENQLKIILEKMNYVIQKHYN